MRYEPPTILIVAAEFMPDTVMVLEVATVFRSTSVLSGNEKAFGMVFLAPVVTLNAPVTVPMVTTALLGVEKLLDEVTFIVTDLPFVIVPAALV